jgi:hypothetical protein
MGTFLLRLSHWPHMHYHRNGMAVKLNWNGSRIKRPLFISSLLKQGPQFKQQTTNNKQQTTINNQQSTINKQ